MCQKTYSSWSGRGLPWWPPFAAILTVVLLLTPSAVWQASPFAAEPARPTRAELDRLIRQLGSERFEFRQAASGALERIGEPALKELEKAAKSEDAEVSNRASEVVRKIRARYAAEVLADIEKRGGRALLQERGWYLDLSRKPFGDKDLPRLKWLGHVRVLDLSGTAVTDAGRTHLQPLSDLWYLGLSETAVTDAGLAQLKGSRGLTCLVLRATKVTGPGLAGLTGLTMLDLGHSSVTDDGLARLKGCEGLWALFLDGTRVGDAGLARLKVLGKLSAVDLRGTKVTAKGAAALKRELPDLRIVR